MEAMLVPLHTLLHTRLLFQQPKAPRSWVAAALRSPKRDQ